MSSCFKDIIHNNEIRMVILIKKMIKMIINKRIRLGNSHIVEK